MVICCEAEVEMTGMPLNIGWDEIALRLALTVIAGLLIGYNRTEHGKAAGLRTILLVCLAASIAMIQVNLLLPTVIVAEKPARHAEPPIRLY
jgi:uncharacterized membrane protein YhiD involved in acid resistance